MAVPAGQIPRLGYTTLDPSSRIRRGIRADSTARSSLRQPRVRKSWSPSVDAGGVRSDSPRSRDDTSFFGLRAFVSSWRIHDSEIDLRAESREPPGHDHLRREPRGTIGWV